MTQAVDQEQDEFTQLAEGTGVPMEAIEHPADGTMSPPVSNPPAEGERAGQTVINNNVYPDRESVGQASGWVLKINPKHNCILPAIDNHTFIGSIWKCGGCGQHWQVFERKGENKGTKALKRISEEVVAKRLQARDAGSDED